MYFWQIRVASTYLIRFYRKSIFLRSFSKEILIGSVMMIASQKHHPEITTEVLVRCCIITELTNGRWSYREYIRLHNSLVSFPSERLVRDGTDNIHVIYSLPERQFLLFVYPWELVEFGDFACKKIPLLEKYSRMHHFII